MPWAYCHCGSELNRPILEDFRFGGHPKCPECGSGVVCDKEEIILEALIEIMDEFDKLGKELKNGDI